MEPTDEQLLADARHDVEAFAALYRRHAGPLLAYCVRRTGDPERGADVMAEVFAVALRRVLSGRHLPDVVAPWLYGVARNQAAEAVRRGIAEDRARRRLGIEPHELTDVDIERIERDTDAAVLVALDDLPEPERAAIRARVVDETAYADIAAAAGVSQATARQRVSRGLARLRTRLERE